MGLLGVDTLGGASVSGSALLLHAEDVQYVHDLAAAVGRVVARDQAHLADLMALVSGCARRACFVGVSGAAVAPGLLCALHPSDSRP